MRSLIVGMLALGALESASGRTRDASQYTGASEIRRESRGSFQFIDPGTNHPITVWFCRSRAIAAETRIVFVMHGSESQTARQACDIAAPYIQTHNVVVLAPQFAEEFYPSDSYVFGNMVDIEGRLLAKSVWVSSTIERLFDEVRREIDLTHAEYDIVGFSGGAQFVHRLTLFVPEARFRRAVAASAARYAVPSWSEKFPFGLANGPIDRTALAAAFSRDFVVILGNQDVTDRERDPASNAQGSSRFARGLRFFAMALDQSASVGVPLRWRLRIVPGVDHSPVPMVRAALEQLDK